MMSGVCSDAVQEALAAFEKRAPEPWCVPLVEALESLYVGSALHWCVDVALELLGRSAIAETTSALQQLKTQGMPASELVHKGREVWYSRAERSPIETVTAKAYEAAAALENGNEQRYKRGVALLISEFLTSGATSSSDSRIAKAIELFNDRCEMLNSKRENYNDGD